MTLERPHVPGTDYYDGTDSIEEPEPEDLVSSDGGLTWFEVEQLSREPKVVVSDASEAPAALREYCARQRFWPAAWLISDHGNAHPFSY